MVTYLVVAAHPDDADIGVAGTAARMANEGHAVHYLLCTSGDAGSEDPTVPADELIRIRETEQQTAGRHLGLSGVHFLRYPDGELQPTLELRRDIVRVMRRLQVDVVLCQDPRVLVDDDSSYLNHPDHRAAGQASVDAAFPAAGNPSAYRELLAQGLQPHKVQEVWLYFTAAQNVNHWVDITSAFEQKINALEAHVSQLGEWATNGAIRREMEKWAAEAATRHNLGFKYAEGFQRIVLRSEQQRPAEATAVEIQNEA